MLVSESVRLLADEIQATLSIDVAQPLIEQSSLSLFTPSTSPASQGDSRSWVLRLDKVHPIVSGNKWFKLKFNLAAALLHLSSPAGINKGGIASFGGSWSNHLHALAYACQQLNVPLRVFIRGSSTDSALLADIQRWGAQVVPLTYGEYRRRNDAEFLWALKNRFPGYQWIPEGADNYLGLLGVASLFASLYEHPDDRQRQIFAASNTLLMACGTGNTLLGARLGVRKQQRLVGVSVHKGRWFAKALRQKQQYCWPMTFPNMALIEDFHGGGFGALNDPIRDYAQQWEAIHKVQLDPIYTAKLLYATAQLRDSGYFAPKEQLLWVHSGGLQGRRSGLLGSGLLDKETSGAR